MSSRLRERRRRRVLIMAGAVLLCLVLLFAACALFFNASFARISHVDVSGEDVIPATSVEEVVRHDIAGDYLWVFPKNNIFLYPRGTIERDVLALFPTLKTAGVHAKNFQTISVVVVERTPQALWCGDTVSQERGTCLLLDENGLAYANAPSYSGAVYQTYYGSLPRGSLPKQFLSPEEFRTLEALAAAFQKKLTPDTLTSVFVDSNSDVHLQFKGGYEIMFALRDDTGQIFDRFSLALTSAPFASHSLSDFEYIDLRFGDKVYYKLK